MNLLLGCTGLVLYAFYPIQIFYIDYITYYTERTCVVIASS